MARVVKFIAYSSESYYTFVDSAHANRALQERLADCKGIYAQVLLTNSVFMAGLGWTFEA